MYEINHMENKVFLNYLENVILLQRDKLLNLANEIHPNLTHEDIRNPQDFPNLIKDPLFNYEDGILTGYLNIKSFVNKKDSIL